MTRTAKVALFCLRFYLILLLTLIGIKFYRMLSAPHDQPGKPEASSSAKP
jgi:hypothetical protein